MARYGSLSMAEDLMEKTETDMSGDIPRSFSCASPSGCRRSALKAHSSRSLSREASPRRVSFHDRVEVRLFETGKRTVARTGSGDY